MSKKPVSERRTKSDPIDHKEPKLSVEVVKDLDLPQDDAEAVRGGRCTIVPARNTWVTLSGF